MAPQSDYYRLCLLFYYGGIWLDSNTFIRDEEYFNNNLKEMEERKAYLLAYNYVHHPMNNIEISALFASRHSDFIRRVLKEWIYGMFIGRERYMKDVINKGLIIKSQKQYNPKGVNNEPFFNSYFFTSYCVQSVLQFQYHENANIILKKSEDWQFKFKLDCNNNIRIMNDIWNNETSLKNYPIITITHRVRRKMRSRGAVII